MSLSSLKVSRAETREYSSTELSLTVKDEKILENSLDVYFWRQTKVNQLCSSKIVGNETLGCSISRKVRSDT